MSTVAYMDARRGADNTIALTRYDTSTGCSLPVEFVPDNKRHKIVLHLEPTFPMVRMSPDDQKLLFASIWCMEEYDEIPTQEQWERHVTCVHPDLIDNVLEAQSKRNSKPSKIYPRIKVVVRDAQNKLMVYGTKYGLDVTHAWIEVEFTGPTQPDKEPTCEIQHIMKRINRMWDRWDLKYNAVVHPMSSRPPLVVAGTGCLSRCRQCLLHRVTPNQHPLAYMCVTAQEESGIYAFSIHKPDVPPIEFVLVNTGSSILIDAVPMDIPPDLYDLDPPLECMRNTDGLITMVYPQYRIHLAVLKVLTNTVPVVIGFNVYDELISKLRSSHIGIVQLHQSHYCVNIGTFPVIVDYLEAFESGPIGPNIGADSGIPLKTLEPRDLETLATHIIGIEATGTCTASVNCVRDLRRLVAITQADKRHLNIRDLCTMTAAPWGWISRPASAMPMGYPRIGAASLITACFRCGLVPPFFIGIKKYKVPGGHIKPTPVGLHHRVGKFDISGAYRHAAQTVDLPHLMIKWPESELEMCTDQIHKVPTRPGSHPDFGQIYVCTYASMSEFPPQTPLQLLMSDPHNPKLIVNSIVGNMCNGVMGEQLQLVAYCTTTVIWEACRRMADAVIEHLTPCCRCGNIHVPDTPSQCSEYERPDCEIKVPAKTDEVVVLNLDAGADTYAHAVLQRAMTDSFLAKNLVLKLPEIGTLMVWDGINSFFAPTGCTPVQCTGKGDLLNAAKTHLSVLQLKRSFFYMATVLSTESRHSPRFVMAKTHLMRCIDSSMQVQTESIEDTWESVHHALCVVGVPGRDIELVHACVMECTREAYGISDDEYSERKRKRDQIE